MGAGTVQKICAVCGDDVARKPRTKDNHGRYYCNDCYQAAVQATTTERPSVAANSDPLDSLAAVAHQQPLAKPAAKAAPPVGSSNLAGAAIYGFVAVICFIWFLNVFMDPKSPDDSKLGAFVVLAPFACMLGWTAFKFLNRRANRHDMITKPLVTLVLCAGVLMIIAITEHNDEQNRAEEAARKESARQQAEFESNQQVRDKAAHMRDLGMNGSDEDLARTYDRAKSIDDGKRARENRLRN